MVGETRKVIEAGGTQQTLKLGTEQFRDNLIPDLMGFQGCDFLILLEGPAEH